MFNSSVCAIGGAVLCLLPYFAAAQPAPPNYSVLLCPAPWREYVDEIGVLIEESPPNVPLVFIDRAGNVFDCLNLAIDKSILRRIQLLESSLPFDRESPLAESGTWPVNICSVGRGRFAEVNYISISLPVNDNILKLERCVVGESCRACNWQAANPRRGTCRLRAGTRPSILSHRSGSAPSPTALWPPRAQAVSFAANGKERAP